MRPVCRLFILLLPSLLQAQPQSFRLAPGCAYDGPQPGNNVYVFESSGEANRIVTELLDALGLQQNFVIKSANIQNALATTESGQRYILYSTSFLEKFKADANTRWAAYSVLAHEIGHHLNGHNFSETDTRQRKLLELEADQFSGSVLRMLGATLSEAQAGIEKIGLEGETNTHPAKTARREAVANGWKTRDEWLRERGMSATPVQRPEPATQEAKQPLTTSSFDDCSRCPAMIKVDGGNFIMGCSDGQGDACTEYEKPAHEVSVPGFYIGKYEVTQAAWQAVMGSNPSKFNNCPNCPVENITMKDVQEFLQRLNMQTGMHFRLPSEAEWEYAARGGRKSKGSKYSGDNRNLGLVAWWYGNSGKKTHPVGERKANELGIFDMSGNVAELCSDYWHGNYLTAPTDGSPWSDVAAGQETVPVVRGGSFLNDEPASRVRYRSWVNIAGKQYQHIGLRLAHD